MSVLKRSTLVFALTLVPMAAPAQGIDAEKLITGVINSQIQGQLRAVEEQTAWEAATASNNTAAYRAYLNSYPKGRWADEATKRLAAMGAAVSAPPITTAPATGATAAAGAATEAALNLTRADRTRIQSRLTALGYDTRGIDGAFGRGSRAAIASWQKAQGANATGYLTAEQARTLNVAATTPAPVAAGGDAIRGEYDLGLSRADRANIQRQLTALGHDTRGTDGIFGAGTRAAISNWQKAQGAAATGYLTAGQLTALRNQAGTPAVAPDASGTDRARIEEAMLNLTRDERAQAQRNLTAQGHNTRGADGIFGSGTRAAIRGWQTANGFAATGYLDGDQWTKLRGQTAAAAPASDKAQIAAWQAGEAALGMDKTTRTLVETRLANAGFKPGKADGTFDADTRAAIKAYQKSKSLPQTGYMNQGTAVALMADVILR